LNITSSNVGNEVNSGYYIIGSGSTSTDLSAVLYAAVKKGSINISGGALSGSETITPTITGATTSFNESGSFFTSANLTKFNVLTSAPSGKTDGTDYLVIDATAGTSTNGSVTGSSQITRGAVTASLTEGWIKSASGITADNTGKTVSVNASVGVTNTDNFEPRYINIVSPALSGGGLSGGGSITPTLGISFSSDDSSGTGVEGANIIAATSAGLGTPVLYDTEAASKSAGYSYFLKVNAESGTGSKTVSRGSVTFANNYKGLVSISSGSTPSGLSATDSQTVSVSANSNSKYIGINAGSCTVSGGTVSASAGTASASVTSTGISDGVSSSATSYYVTASASATGGSASITDVKDTHTAGYIPAKSATTVISGSSQTGTTNSDSKTIYLKAGVLTSCSKSDGISSGSGTYKSYTELSDVVVPTEGFLIIKAGYYPNSKISLDALLGGKSDTSTLSTADIRYGFTAYDVNGQILNGAMPDVDPSFTVSASGGAASSTTTITPKSSSDIGTRPTSGNDRGFAINKDSAPSGLYVKVAATGTGGAGALTLTSVYNGAATGYLNKANGAAAGSGSKSAVSTSSSDTNYIDAYAGGTITGNTGSFTTSATITPKSSSDIGTRPTSGNDRGFAINQDSTPDALYVKIAATSSGNGTAASNQTLSVKDKYVLEDIVINNQTPSKSSSSGDTNYILASDGSSVTVTAGTISGSATITTYTSSPSDYGGYALCYNDNKLGGSTAQTAYVKVKATASASATAGTGGTVTVKDKYMLGNITYAGSAISSTSLTSDENYIPASKTSSVTSGTTTISAASVGSFSYTPSSYNSSTGAVTKSNSGTATVSGITGTVGVSATIKDKYMLNNIGGTASI